MSGNSTLPDDPSDRTEGDLLGLLVNLNGPNAKRPTPQQFEEFHAANPQVYRALVDAAREYRRATGQLQCGMSLLYERARWVLEVETTETQPKLNNNWQAFYARLLMDREEDLAGMFHLRRSAADNWNTSNAA